MLIDILLKFRFINCFLFFSFRDFQLMDTIFFLLNLQRLIIQSVMVNCVFLSLRKDYMILKVELLFNLLIFSC